MKNNGNYAFCIAFLKSLSQNRQIIIEQESSRAARKSTDTCPKVGDSSPPAPATGDSVDSLIKQCLQAALPQWNNDPYHTSRYDVYAARSAAINPSGKTGRVIEIIEQAIALSDLDICKTLFIDLLKGPDTTTKRSMSHSYLVFAPCWQPKAFNYPNPPSLILSNWSSDCTYGIFWGRRANYRTCIYERLDVDVETAEC